MRFLLRALSGVFFFALTVGLLALGAGILIRAGGDDDSGQRGGKSARERVYTVSVRPVERETLTPVTRAFGRLQSWQSADVRAASGGVITAIGAGVRDGGRVRQGELLFEIDPITAETNLASRETDLAEALAELSEAKRALELSIEELATTEAQHRLRQSGLARARDLKKRGFDTDAGVETAELNLASSAQALVARRQAIAQAEARVARAEIGIERRTLTRDAARRDLEDTRIHAAFDGVLSNVDTVVGRRVGANERLATLIDPASLEVAFRVSVEAYAQLVDERGDVLQQPMTIEFEMGDRDIQLPARVSRVSAEVGDGQTGRLVYAELQPPIPGALGVGDFVTVAIDEPALENVSMIPRAASTDDGRVLVVNGEDRLEEVQVDIRRRQGDSLIVSGVPTDARLVLTRTAQLGPGVQVKAIGPDPKVEQRETVQLTADQQKQLRAAIEANNRMPADVRARLLERIDSGEVSTTMWQRFQDRMSGAAPEPSGDTIALDEQRRQKLIDAVSASTQLPDAARERVLNALAQPEVPVELVERIETRMGGQ